MDIQKLKDNAEDVIPETEELTEEQKKQRDELLAQMAARKFRPRVDEISKYMDFTHKKLDDVYKDIENKTCGLSLLNREFLQTFKREYINSLFMKRYL